MADLMIDIEALGKSPDSVILTIGAQVFDPSPECVGWITEPMYDSVSDRHYMPQLNIRVDVDTQISEFNRQTDEDTIAWWAKQSPEAQEEAMGVEDRLPLSVSLERLIEVAQLCNRVWSKGPTYDIMMLEHAMQQAKKRIPWKFWNVRDARTVYGLCPNLDTRLNGHIALDDCRNQIVLLQEAFRQLGIKAIK
jgi:exodeoxyribonuclease VIII